MVYNSASFVLPRRARTSSSIQTCASLISRQRATNSAIRFNRMLTLSLGLALRPQRVRAAGRTWASGIKRG
ncbi:hypothetical protein BDW68DRAFT_165383 [Aspergillus falconensis]